MIGICTDSRILLFPGSMIMQNLGKVFISNNTVEFDIPNCDASIIAVVWNDSKKPYAPRGMQFPTNSEKNYVYKRSFFDRIFKRPGKLAIPPRTARLAILTRKIKAQYVVVASFE